MKHQIISPAPSSPVTSTVTVLQFRGQLRLDPDPLSEIYAAQGEDAAEEIVCRTLSDLAHRLADLQSLQRRSVFAQMSMPARRIAAISGQIGLVELACAAENLANAASQADGIAVGSTLNRLERCFDLAMSEVWGFQ